MDGHRFDNLSRALAHGLSRRTLIRGLLGGTLGGAAASLSRHESEAVICRQPGVLCAKDTHCCSNSCNSDSHRCNCPNGEVLCGHTCAGCCDDTNCDPSDFCQQGQCVPRCTPTTCAAEGVVCGPLGDGCGNTLPCGDCAYGSCQGGQCVCPDGTTHCGNECVTDCTGGQVLDQTTCVCACPDGASLCNGQCVSTTCSGNQEFDSSSCTCGCPTDKANDCSDGQVFDQTTCTCNCPAGLTLISRACSDGSTHCVADADAENFCCTNIDCYYNECTGNVCFENPCIQSASCIDHVCQDVEYASGVSCTGSNPCGEYTCDASGDCIQTGDQPSTTTCGSNGQVCFEGDCLPCFPDGEEVSDLSCPDERDLCCSKQCYPVAGGAVCGTKPLPPQCPSGSDGHDCIPADAPCHVGTCSDQQCIDTGTGRPFGFVCGASPDRTIKVCIPGVLPECTHCVGDGEALGPASALASCDTLVKECCSGKCHVSDGSPVCGSGTCTIGGNTYQAFEKNPSNECQWCDPSQSHGVWTNNTGATCGKSDSSVCCTDGGITYQCGPFGHDSYSCNDSDSGVCCSDGTCCLGCDSC